jgi:cytoskeleton protein RodZ
VHHRPAMEELDPGTTLKQAREARGLSIDDLGRVTKINRSILVALEAYDTAHLPASVYTKGFVKAYAREVGLDPEGMAAVYLAQSEPVAAPPANRTPGSAPPPHMAGITLRDDNAKILVTSHAHRVGGFVTLLCAIGLVVYVWSFSREPEAPAADSQVAAPEADAAVAASTPAVPDVVNAAATIVEPLAGPLQIELRITGACWVVATADGTQVLAKLLPDGDRRTVTASDVVTLRVGDPGALSFAINGHPGRPLGARGEPVDVRITRDNFREFLAAR